MVDDYAEWLRHQPRNDTEKALQDLDYDPAEWEEERRKEIQQRRAKRKSGREQAF